MGIFEEDKFWKEVDGNLITLAKAGNFDVITHGCNCQKDFGKGIALDFKKKYPLSFQVDYESPSPFGGVSICTDYPEVIIVNSYTQRKKGKSYGGNDSDNARYDAIRSCMKIINETYPNKHIGLPLIGSGYAGLKWSKVKKILKGELINMDVTIVHFR